LNALSQQLLGELAQAVGEADENDKIRCIVITGNEKAFAAGADISEMADLSFAEVYGRNLFVDEGEAITRCRKPVIAAVAGYALGGGCELAMMCDFIIAADTAKFGQPEINLGVMAGMGGSQRLTRLVGKSKSMDMHLTGRFMDAAEAEIKESVNQAEEMPLGEGLLFERRLFHSLFATEDQSEGMSAFVEKREAQFRDK